LDGFAPKDAAPKTELFAYVVSQERSTNQLRNDTFHAKTRQSAKNQLDPAKNQNRPKMLHTPFLHESLQFVMRIRELTSS